MFYVALWEDVLCFFRSLGSCVSFCYEQNSMLSTLSLSYTTPQIGDSSITSGMIAKSKEFLTGTISLTTQRTYEELLQWAKSVHDTGFADLDSIHHYLVRLVGR